MSTEDESKYNQMKTILASNAKLFPPNNMPKVDSTENSRKDNDHFSSAKQINEVRLNSNLLATKENQNLSANASCNGPALSHASKKAKTNGGNTKRKLSETFTQGSAHENSTYSDSQNHKSQKSSKINKKTHAININKTTPAYTPLTPSPPQPYLTQYHQVNSMSKSNNDAHYQENIGRSDYNSSQNHYFSQNQQMYANPAFSYSFEHTDSLNKKIQTSHALPTLNHGYSSENAHFFDYANQQFNAVTYQNYQHQNSSNYADQSHSELQKSSIYTTQNNLYFNANFNTETYAAYF